MGTVKLNKNSKISYIEVYNFMAYEHAKAYFDEQGILNLKGFNHSGKSAFETAIAVCLMNAYLSKQSKFIRYDSEYFRIIVGFDDGVSIVRDKYISGQSLYELYKDGECIFTTKQGNKLSKISDVPDVIKKYLDLIETDTGYLNYQTRRDPLWLVETKGSENYSALNEILKSEETSRANAMLNSDINQLNNDITILESEIQRKEMQYQSCIGVTEEMISSIQEKELVNQIIDKRSKGISSIREYEEDYEDIKVGYQLEKLDYSNMSKIAQIKGTLDSLEDIKILKEVPVISAKNFGSISSLYGVVESLENLGFIGKEVDRVEGINKVRELANLICELKELISIENKLSELDTEKDNLMHEKEEFIKEAEAQGRYFVECENCGTLMEVDTNGVHS